MKTASRYRAIKFHGLLTRLMGTGLMFLFTCLSFSYAQTFQLATSNPTAGSQRSSRMAIDKLGDKYVVGEFEGTVSFGNGVTLTSRGARDLFVVKYTCDSIAVWANAIGGGGDDYSEWNI